MPTDPGQTQRQHPPHALVQDGHRAGSSQPHQPQADQMSRALLSWCATGSGVLGQLPPGIKTSTKFTSHAVERDRQRPTAAHATHAWTTRDLKVTIRLTTRGESGRDKRQTQVIAPDDLGDSGGTGRPAVDSRVSAAKAFVGRDPALVKRNARQGEYVK